MFAIHEGNKDPLTTKYCPQEKFLAFAEPIEGQNSCVSFTYWAKKPERLGTFITTITLRRLSLCLHSEETPIAPSYLLLSATHPPPYPISNSTQWYLFFTQIQTPIYFPKHLNKSLKSQNKDTIIYHYYITTYIFIKVHKNTYKST